MDVAQVCLIGTRAMGVLSAVIMVLLAMVLNFVLLFLGDAEGQSIFVGHCGLLFDFVLD